MNISIVKRLPGAAEYNDLRRAVEWPVYPAEVVEKALANSLFAVVAQTETGEIAGMGRVLGDGAIYLHIQDVIIHPDFQRHGIGKMIMKELLQFVNSIAVTNTNIGLMCSKGREPFYRSLGFVDRPAEKFGAGMIMIL